VVPQHIWLDLPILHGAAITVQQLASDDSRQVCDLSRGRFVPGAAAGAAATTSKTLVYRSVGGVAQWLAEFVA